jgi:hypothetical protein
VSLLITVPVFGQHEYTHAVVADLEREGAEYLIVDNRGDYPKVSNERVITPGENLGLGGGQRPRVPNCVLGGLLPRNDAEQRYPAFQGVCRRRDGPAAAR